MILQSDAEVVNHALFQWFTITEEQRVFILVGMLVLIGLYFIILQIPVKKKDPWKNVRHRNRKKAKKASKDDQGS